MTIDLRRPSADDAAFSGLAWLYRTPWARAGQQLGQIGRAA
jgi:hypothetical protein